MRVATLFTAALSFVPTYATFAITGATGGVYPRLEVRDLHNDADAWNLFMNALYRFHASNSSALTSYYQIAGIHGVPNVPWDGAEPSQTALNEGAVGYCPHTSIVFPVWHRVYMALFEQIFQEQVQAVVNDWPAGPTKTLYANIAKTLRFPYFDWAALPPDNLPPWPLIISTQEVQIQGPDGPINIINPLFRHDFNPFTPSDFIFQPWSFWPVTLRYPTQNTSPGGSSQNNLAVNAFANNRINIRNQLYSVFTQCSQYPEFSNDGSADSTPGCSISLEGIHDSIHTMIGGSNQGHMTYLWYAAFDPAFWLHHMNVDRIFAMWQTIYPNTYVVNQVSHYTTYTIPNMTTIGANSALTPFHKDTHGTFWTANDAKSWTQFGYTYPEFVDSAGNAAAIKSYVNALYGPSATRTAGSSKRTAIPDVPAAAPEAVVTEAAKVVEREIPGALPTAAVDLLTNDQGQVYHYTVNLEAQRFAVGSSFNVFIFFGTGFSEDPTQWAFEEAMIGRHGFLSMPNMKKHKSSVSGAVPLTTALTRQIQLGALPDMSLENVVPFLNKNLQWRIATTDGQALDPTTVPGFEAAVVYSNCTLGATPEDFPTWTDWEELPEATNGRPGGLQLGMTSKKTLMRMNRDALEKQMWGESA